MHVGIEITIHVLTDLIDGGEQGGVGLGGGVGERAVDVATYQPDDVRPAARQIVKLYLRRGRMTGLQKGAHVLNVIGSVSGLDAVRCIGHDHDAGGQVAGVELRARHALLHGLHDLRGRVLDVAEQTARAAFQ